MKITRFRGFLHLATVNAMWSRASQLFCTPASTDATRDCVDSTVDPLLYERRVRLAERCSCEALQESRSPGHWEGWAAPFSSISAW